MTESKHNNEDIWKKVYDTDARVSSIEGQVKDVSMSVGRIEQHLLNKPPVNITAWVSVVIGLITLFGGTVLALVNYVDLTLVPVRAELVQHDTALKQYNEFKHQTHYEIGKIHQWSEAETLGAYPDRIRELEKSVSRLEAPNSDSE